MEKDIDTSSTFDMDRISVKNEERLKKFKQNESNRHDENGNNTFDILLGDFLYSKQVV